MLPSRGALGSCRAPLACLLSVYGVVSPRPSADCEAGVWLLTQQLLGEERTVVASLRETAATPTTRIWATGTPFDCKDELKHRGYRWMPHERNGIPPFVVGRRPAGQRRGGTRLARRGLPPERPDPQPGRAPAPRHHRPRPLAGRPDRAPQLTVCDIGETAHAIRRETRVIDEQAPRGTPHIRA